MNVITELKDGEVGQVPIHIIFADPSFNCRGLIGPGDVRDLATSIKSYGLQQPIVIQPYESPIYKYRVVMGHRRYEATKFLQQPTIQCKLSCNLSESQARALNLIENLERKNLTVMQEAHALKPFAAAGLSVQQTADLIKQSTSWVQTRFTALRLPERIQDEIAAGKITATQIKDIAKIPSESGKFAAVRCIKDAHLRNQKVNLKPKIAKKMIKKESALRTQTELYNMQDHIHETFGPNFATRLLGWATGNVKTEEIFDDLEQQCKEAGRGYTRPATA